MQLCPLPVCPNPPANPHCRIFALGDGKQWWAADFLKEAYNDHKEDFEKLLALFERCMCHGVPRNKQKVRKMVNYDGLFEFKAGALRLFWFWEKGKVIVCTHGFVKKSQETPENELKTAQKRMKDYKEAKKKNEVIILEK